MTNPTFEPTVFVVDAESGFRDTVQRLVESMHVACRAFPTGRDFLQQCDGSGAGCVILEFRIADMSGLQIQRRLLDQRATLPVIFASQFGTVSTAVRAMKSGALDVVEKPCKEEELWDLIQRAIQLSNVRQQKMQAQREWKKQLERLSAEEVELLNFLVSGKRGREIAPLQNVSVRTIEARRSKLFKKLGIDTMVELMNLVASSRSGYCCLMDMNCPYPP